MLALAKIQAREPQGGAAKPSRPAGLLSFTYQPNSYDPDRQRVHACTVFRIFWKAVGAVADLQCAEAGARISIWRDIVFRQHAPTAPKRDVEGLGGISASRTTISIATGVVTHMRDEYSTFGWGESSAC